MVTVRQQQKYFKVMALCIISDSYEVIQSSLQELNHLLDSNTPVRASVTPVPPVMKSAEKVREPVTVISVRETLGLAAVTNAKLAYGDLHIHPDYSQRSARRTPGVLWYSTSPLVTNKVMDVIARINLAKTAIEKEITTKYSTRADRFEKLREVCPGVMAVHIYRQIRCFDEPMTSARFSWLCKDVVSKVDKDKLLERLNADIKRLGDECPSQLLLLKQNILSTPEAMIRARRDIQPQPVANLMINGKVKTVTATMPLIVLQNEPLEIKPLTTFDASVKRGTRADKQAVTPLGSFNGSSYEARN